MNLLRSKVLRDEGFTLLEVLLSVIIVSIMVLGLTIILMAFHEHLDRSWAIRTMDQYGNDVVERLTHELRNAVDVQVRNGPRNTHKIEVKYLDPWVKDLFHIVEWEADLRRGRILANRQPIDPTYPPLDPGRGESFEVVQFTLTPFGEAVRSGQWEYRDKNFRNEKFLEAAYEINLILRYNRAAVGGRDHRWTFEKVYFNRIYMRNKNLVIEKGITGSE